jgi:outer membrane protein assembly factor BamB
MALAALVGLMALAGCGSTPPIRNPGLRPQPASYDWTRFGYDSARTGDNTAETRLTTTTAGGLATLWQVRLPGVADSSPILLHALAFPGGPRDVLYASTRDGRLLALDAGDGALIWQRQPSGPNITHSSPVADPSRTAVYAYGLDGYVHRYNAISGAETTSGGWPARVTLMTQTEKESSALNIANGRLYVTTSG